MLYVPIDLTWLDPDFIFQLLRFVPVAWIGSRRLILLIPDLQAVLFCGSMSPMLQAFMSAFTQSDHVFLGLPHALEHGTSILVTDLIQDEEQTTCPYHPRRLEHRAAVPSCIPSLAHNNSMEISSWGLMPQIHLIIDLSFLGAAVGLEPSGPKFRFHEEEQSGHRPQTPSHELWGICALMSGLAGASWNFPRQYNTWL